MSDTMHVTVKEGIGCLTIDHPPVNVLTRSVLAAFRERLAALAAEPTMRVLVVSACGRHFSAGADVAEHLPPTHEALVAEFLETVEAVVAFPVPVIAAVRGKCLGAGFELVLGADVIVAADDAAFGQPEIVLGVIPPAACVLLARRLPAGVANQVLYSGDPLPADEALRWGLAQQVVPAAELDHAARQLAARVARHSASSLRVLKRAVDRGQESTHAALGRAARIYDDELMHTHDAVEGLTAFLERRSPAWRHG